MADSIVVKDISSTKELESSVRRLMGIRAYISGIGKLGERNVINTGSVQVELIDDDRINRRTVAFTKVPDLVSIEVERRGDAYILRRPVEYPVDRFEQRYRGLIVRHENAVLKHSYRNLVRIPEIDLAMRPIANILIQVHEYGEFIPSVPKGKASSAKQIRTQRYVRLLTDLGFIERSGTGYRPGSNLPHGFDPETPTDEIYEEFLGKVLQTSHQYLTDALHLTMIKPFLRIENSYYWPAHRVGRNLGLRRERLKHVYSDYYGSSPSKFENHLQSLLHKHTLESKSGMISGAEEILSPLLEQDFNDWLRNESSIVAA
jgi:hypothetical protein